MDKNNVTSKAKVQNGEIVGEPKSITKTRITDEGNMIVEVTTIFEVADPDKVFGLKGEGISMVIDADN